MTSRAGSLRTDGRFSLVSLMMSAGSLRSASRIVGQMLVPAHVTKCRVCGSRAAVSWA